jgi:hypothetical protein
MFCFVTRPPKVEGKVTDGEQNRTGVPAGPGDSVAHVVVADSLFLGNDLLAWLLLALGGAMLVGNLLAVVRPPARAREGDLARAPVGRSLTMAAIGLIAAVWALASLVS